MTRPCTKCGNVYAEEEYSWRQKSKGLRQTQCKPCLNSTGKRNYRDARDTRMPQALARNARNKAANLRRLFDYYAEHGCVDCDERDPVVLEFDHREGEQKVAGVGTLVSKGWCWDRILGEIKKCDVRCANCHRRRTAKVQGWYKSIGM